MNAEAPRCPIGSLQAGMVLASLRAPREGVYLVQDVCEFADALDVAFLREAWREVVRRHPAIGRAVGFRDGYPAEFRPDEAAAQYWREEASTTRLEEFLHEDRERGFDFDAGAPVRITVIPGGDGVTLVWTIHHALIDGRSMTVAWQEWLALYDALVRRVALPPAAPASGDPAPSGQEHAETFWRDYLGGVSQTTDYIVERLRCGGGEPGVTGRERVLVSEDLTQRLREFAAHSGVTLNNVVQGAWALLLSRYSGRDDVVFGVARSGRLPAPEDGRKVGFFLNTLPLRALVDPKAAPGPWLQEIRRRWLALREVEHTPLQQAVKWGGLPPGMPPFESLLNYEHEPPSETLAKLGGHWSGATFRRLQRTESPLTLAACGSPALALELIFDAGRFSRRTMAGAAAHLKALLESFVSQPEATLCGLNMLAPEEGGLLLGGPARMPLPGVCMHQVFEDQVERTPSRTAIDTGRGCLSYAELNERSNRVAWRLREAGMGPGDLVAVAMESSPESVIAVMAVLKAGGAFLPLEPGLPRERLLSMVAGARPKLALSRAGGAIPGCETLTVEAWDAEPAAPPCENLPNAAMPDDLAYAIFTSGSSGEPKAVAMTHRGLVNHSLAASAAYGVSETDRRLQMAFIGTDVFVAEVFNYLCRGAALVFGWDRRSGSVREFLRCLEDRRITITGVPSAWWSEWTAALEQSGAALPACLRAVIVGMDKMDPAALRVWTKFSGKKLRLFNAYGPTETSPTATVYEAGSSPWETGDFVPIGRPLANTTVYVLDPHGSPVLPCVAGELYIGGPGVARGYWNRPALTAERFVPDPFSAATGGRLYRTGDIGFCLPDGNLVFVGRADRQVKIRGFRVELDEIETILAGHEDVKQCAVVLAGEGERRFIAAFVAPRDGNDPRPETLRPHLARRLPEHMIPQAFVNLAALPVLPNGKIDRRALPVRELRPERSRNGFEAPSTETERRLAEIWQEVLDRTPVGATDDFFESGGGSLAATRLITLVEARFGREMPASLVWRAPTLARMASWLDGAAPAGAEDHGAVVALEPHGAGIPFFCFPGADDDPGQFVPLVRSLGGGRPFYVVRDPRPLAERGFYTVEQAAERLTEAVRQVRKTGPYILGGHCFGGLLAFEAARRLAALGETVRAVVMIEVAAPGYPKVLRHWRNYLRVAEPILRGERRVKLADARQHLRVLSKLARKRGAAWTRRALSRAPLAEPGDHPNAAAGRNYVPRPLACDIVQIIAAGERHSTVILDDPRLGWKELTSRTFSVVETPGTAADIFRPPYARELAARIGKLLGDLERR